MSTAVRSLRVCDIGSGDSTILVEDIVGELIASPDRAWFAFVATEPGSYRLKPHIFRVGVDGSNLIQLDTQVFPEDQVVAAQIINWSEDGRWLELSLWDGHEGGYYNYKIRTDGSGEFQMLP